METDTVAPSPEELPEPDVPSKHEQRGTSSNAASSFEDVYLEIGIEFGQNCREMLDKSARRTLRGYFDRNFLCLLQDGSMDWGNPADRGFALFCAADLARAVSADVAGSGGVVSADIVNEAAKRRIPVWEDRCHLPAGNCGVRDKRGGCLKMREILQMPAKHQ